MAKKKGFKKRKSNIGSLWKKGKKASAELKDGGFDEIPDGNQQMKLTDAETGVNDNGDYARFSYTVLEGEH